MPIQFNNASIELDGIYSILVSDIQPDTATDYYVRILTFFDKPAGTVNRAPCLTLNLYGGSQTSNDKSELEIQTPSLEFVWWIAAAIGSPIIWKMLTFVGCASALAA